MTNASDAELLTQVNGMKVAELQTLASALGIPGAARRRKGELIALIEERGPAAIAVILNGPVRIGSFGAPAAAEELPMVSETTAVASEDTPVAAVNPPQEQPALDGLLGEVGDAGAAPRTSPARRPRRASSATVATAHVNAERIGSTLIPETPADSPRGERPARGDGSAATARSFPASEDAGGAPARTNAGTGSAGRSGQTGNGMPRRSTAGGNNEFGTPRNAGPSVGATEHSIEAALDNLLADTRPAAGAPAAGRGQNRSADPSRSPQLTPEQDREMAKATLQQELAAVAAGAGSFVELDTMDAGGRNRNRVRRTQPSDDLDEAPQETDAADFGGNSGASEPYEGGRRNNRFRDRKRRPQTNAGDEPELLDDDVLIPIAGILDVLDSYAFVRTSGYFAGPSDVYVSLGQVRKYGLRKGDAVVGAIRQPRDGEQATRQKFNALAKVDTVTGQTPDEAAQRADVAKLVPVHPQERLRFETDRVSHIPRLIDLFAPIGKGQRTLIVAPPKVGITTVLRQLADGIATNHPGVHLIVVLVADRPEDVTDLQRSVRGEVVATTFDRPAEEHTAVTELAVERAKRLLELGHDVAVLVDSLSRLTRAYQATLPASGRTLSGIDAGALYAVKRLLGAARKIENGGSLTLVGVVSTETGSVFDDAILEELVDSANSEVRLTRAVTDPQDNPTVDVVVSETERDDLLLSADEFALTRRIRCGLNGAEPNQVTREVLTRLIDSQSNTDFLGQLQRVPLTVPPTREAGRR